MAVAGVLPPDGRFFAYVRAASRQDGVSRVWVLRASDSKAFAVTDGMSNDWSPIWAKDARMLFFVTNRGGGMDLWQQPLSAEGEPRGNAAAVTVGIGMQHAAFTRDGRKLVYSKGGAVANVWRVPILQDRDFVLLISDRKRGRATRVEAYESHRILGPRYRNDMLHIALATVASVDVVVSWNFRHIVRLDKIQMFNGVNIERGVSGVGHLLAA